MPVGRAPSRWRPGRSRGRTAPGLPCTDADWQKLDPHFAAVPSPMGTIGGFAAEQFDIDLVVGLPAALGEDFLGPGDDRLADPLGLLQRIDAGDQATGGAAETIRIGSADCQSVGGRPRAPSTATRSGPTWRRRTSVKSPDHVQALLAAWVADLIQSICSPTLSSLTWCRAPVLAGAVGLDLDDGSRSCS